ncbi:Glutathione S-transferase-like protein ustS [Mycena sanguinolenta]|uniref:Glutathione S-transferase-like protein ustS n=1 Tax=Mycena sanguinolenta TaxID=230812 RepID=A0A8H6XBY3_9AGAR|nr:Glutathione S-transferase-like protein ustS [Mycena sanguinolenta]
MSIITLYDIASTHPGQAWSPNTAKARQGIPHKTVFLEYPEIEPLCKKLGAKPTSQTSLQYTLPVIYDPSTNAVVSNSIEIAQYLDATYPNTPRLIPEGTAAFHYAFTEAFEATLPPLLVYTLPASLPFLNSASQDYFRRTREELFGGRRLEDVTPTGDEHAVMWKRLEDAFGTIDGWIRKNGADSKYFMGDTLCYADISVAGWLRWTKMVLGKDQWESILTWHGGRWASLMKELEKYNIVF